jgi:hypothetical protein
MRLAAHSTTSPTPGAMRQAFIMTCIRCEKPNHAFTKAIFWYEAGMFIRGDQIGLFKLVTLNCILNRITGVTFGC